MKKTKLQQTSEEFPKERFIKLLEDSGFSRIKAMKESGIGLGIFYRLIELYGIELPAGNVKHNVTKEELAGYIKDGMNNKDIQTKLGLNKSQVGSLVVRHGLAFKECRSPKLIVSKEALLEIIDKKDMSVKEIAKRFGLEKHQVDYLLKEYDLQRGLGGYGRIGLPVDETYFEKINTLDKAYHFGLLMADGYVRKEVNAFGLRLIEPDKYILERFLNYMGASHKLTFTPARNDNSNNQYEFSIGSKKMAKDLGDLGMHPQKSLTCEFPNLSSVGAEFLWAFIRGYCEGDGFWGWWKIKGPAHAKFSVCVSEAFGAKLKEIIETETGALARLKKSHNKIWVVQLSGRLGISRLLAKIYENSEGLRMDRKYEKALVIMNYTPKTGKTKDAPISKASCKTIEG